MFESRRRLALVALLALAVAPMALADELDEVPGYVDGTPFIDLVGEGAVSVEITLQGSLLQALTGFDEELQRLAGGLESIHAVVLDLKKEEGRAVAVDRIKELIATTERRLRKSGWQRLAMIREDDGEVRVLVLNDDENIQGLVVMISGKDEVVFANVAGVLDLAAIQAIGESFDIPGLERVDVD